MAIENWDATFDTHPVGTDNVADGDDRILDTRQTVRALLEPEHDAHQIDANHTDSGRHKEGSARAFFEQGSVAEPDALLDYSNAGDWPAIADELDKQGSDALDNGRLWVDWDDCQPYVREEEARVGPAWTDINTNYGMPGPRWISLYARSWTVEKSATTANDTPAVNNTRELIDGLTESITIPNDGKSYELLVKVHIKYCTGTPGRIGFWLEETAPAAADRDAVLTGITTVDAGGHSIGYEATLCHLYTAPDNGTTYTFEVDMAAEVAAQLDVNPSQAGLFNHALVDFAAVTAWSKMYLELRPRYLTTDYCF